MDEEKVIDIFKAAATDVAAVRVLALQDVLNNVLRCAQKAGWERHLDYDTGQQSLVIHGHDLYIEANHPCFIRFGLRTGPNGFIPNLAGITYKWDPDTKQHYMLTRGDAELELAKAIREYLGRHCVD